MMLRGKLLRFLTFDFVNLLQILVNERMVLSIEKEVGNLVERSL